MSVLKTTLLPLQGLEKEYMQLKLLGELKLPGKEINYVEINYVAYGFVDSFYTWEGLG